MSVLTLSEKLDQLDIRYQEMTQELSSPEIVSDSARFQKLAKQHSDLEEIVNKHREFKQIEKDLAGTRQMIVESEDAEMRHMAQDEERQLTTRKEQIERELKLLLIPNDPNDEKNVILEIRAGTGGDEAGIFAGDLFRMYSRYAESQRWKVEVLESSPASMGGVKEIVAAIQGNKVYSKLKYESGVHRVQRVPATETQGRIHTSAATVAVLPEADEIDIKIEAKDLRIDTFCSSGPGDNRSTPLTPRSASRIFRVDSSSLNKTKNLKSRIARKPCAFCAPASMKWSSKSSRPRSCDSQPALAGVPFAIEGDAAAVRASRRIVKELGGKAYTIRKQDKVAYHAWGTFASPLLTALLATTEQVAAAAGVSQREAKRRMLPILRQTLANYAALDAAGSFSGPIVRGDVETIRRHLGLLRKVPAAREIYVAMARAAVLYLPGKRKQLVKKLLDA